jgi:hypothetical protein
MLENRPDYELSEFTGEPDWLNYMLPVDLDVQDM